MVEQVNQRDTPEQAQHYNAGRLSQARKDYLIYRDQVQPVIAHLLQEEMGLTGDDRLAVICDSASDLAAVRACSEQAIAQGVETEILYFRDLYLDDCLPIEFLEEEIASRPVKVFSHFKEDSQETSRGIAAFRQGGYTVAMNFMSGSYDARAEIGEAGYSKAINIAELPGITIETFTSDVFRPDGEEMKQAGQRIKQVLEQYQSFHLIDDNGTDLLVTIDPGTHWISEADLRFDTRGGQAVVDNLPKGEVYTDLKLGQGLGTLVVTQTDTDVLGYAVRNLNLTSQEARDIIYDPQDPITLTINKGMISQVKGGRRAQILEKYLADQAVEDIAKGRDKSAPYVLAELGVGINKGARQPENGGVTTLESEKCFGIWHIGIGGHPVVVNGSGEPLPPETLNHSDTHIDQGLRGKVQVFGLRVSEDGQQTEEPILLT